MGKVILDPGHGGNDPGDIYQGRAEKDDNLRLALAIGEILRNEGYEVSFTRTDDTYVSQLDRVKIANQEEGDILVSIHRIIGEFESPSPWLGFFIYSEGGLAEDTAKNIGKELEPISFINYGINVRTDLPLLRQAQMPSVMIGVGNLSSELDNLLFDTQFDKIALSIARGIMNSLEDKEADNVLHGNSGTEARINTSDKVRTCIYRIQIGLLSCYNDARNLQKKFLCIGYPAEIIKNEKYYVVLVGLYHDLTQAVQQELALRWLGYNTLVVSV
ncbi:N-acetylmuramoyl-L-alanine amidase [Mobilitalea sibirica]|uniref:N-acetylmuramoyl-L-alanine amidase n=1 Tax=Mobilitalea sibirica TaxID=1462919 RepID=A0A8J7H871_9FIRM|nr:N-acetylmuramoyl-L-alanine amidase [Mobilitalea sibirica]MBH1941416.1 N-acetylmuramoyl-L-alanine amidase [Mobilitalea sibirica]